MTQSGGQHSQIIELRGHIIDSHIFARVLDDIMDSGNEFNILTAQIGQTRTDPSFARIEVVARSQQALDEIISHLLQIGVHLPESRPAQLAPVVQDGVFPEGFYSTTNLPTRILLETGWVDVEYPEMDCGIVVRDGRAETIAVSDVRRGDLIVVGHDGIDLVPIERRRVPTASQSFAFMSSSVSSEKPKAVLLGEIAREMKAIRARGGTILFVGGPAAIHTGSAHLLCRLIESGYVQVLFAGNALAAHDIEGAFFGTSLGVSLVEGRPLEAGHEHHLRAINRIRAAGSIANAVERGILTRGVMYTCVKHDVEFLLAGSIRDDGPLPDVITDTIEAQRRMRAIIRRRGIDMAIMVSTMLHSIAVGNLLPATTTTVAVDINPAVVTKLADRGSWQTVGLVMDASSFLRELLEELGIER